MAQVSTYLNFPGQTEELKFRTFEGRRDLRVV